MNIRPQPPETANDVLRSSLGSEAENGLEVLSDLSIVRVR